MASSPAADWSRDVYSRKAKSRDSQLHFRRQHVNAIADEHAAFGGTTTNVISTSRPVVVE